MKKENRTEKILSKPETWNCICTSCAKISKVPLKRCSSCKMARYCNEDCQKTDWATHKKNVQN